ncbi:MAG: hypothetical protein GTO24_03165 [candidate division Zixibacteria bacterium]|nr:hypothetical protein [candidate division Zixibacteria bacterium]
MNEREDYVTRKEIEKLCHDPGTFAQNMDNYNLEKVIFYFVDELRRRQEQKRLKDF